MRLSNAPGPYLPLIVNFGGRLTVERAVIRIPILLLSTVVGIEFNFFSSRVKIETSKSTILTGPKRSEVVMQSVVRDLNDCANSIIVSGETAQCTSYLFGYYSCNSSA